MAAVLTVAQATRIAATALWLLVFPEERASHTPPNEIDRKRKKPATMVLVELPVMR